MLGLPVLFLAWAGLGAWAAIIAAAFLWHRAWRQAVAGAVLPLVVLGVGLDHLAFIRFCDNAGDTIHFYLRHPAYMKIVRAAPQNGNPRLLTINLGRMSWASRGYFCDESDEVIRDTSLQSPGWQVRAQDSELGYGYGAIRIPGPLVLTRHSLVYRFIRVLMKLVSSGAPHFHAPSSAAR